MKTKLPYLSSLLAIGLLFISCEKNDEADQTTGTLSVSPTELTFEAAGNTPQTITVTSDHVKWSAEVSYSGAEWITLECSGDAVTVSVADNTSEMQRTGLVTIRPASEQLEPVSVTVVQAAQAVLLDSEALISYYAQDYLFQTNGTGEWLLEFFTADSDHEIYWQDFGKDGYWNASLGNGRRISLYLYCDPASDFFHPEISDGEYTAVQEIEAIAPMTMLTSTYYLGTDWPQGSYISDCTNGSYSYENITGGKVTLTHNGSTYNIHLDLTLDNGNGIAYDFSGEMRLSLLGTPPYYSTLTDDLAISGDDLTQCAVTGVYENYMDSEIMNWNIRFLNEGMTADMNGQVSGDGTMVSLLLFSPAAAGTETIPDGTYDISTSSEYGALEYTALIGEYNPMMNNSGCFVEIYDGDETSFAPLSSGSITTSHLGEGNYLFKIDGMDDNNHHITVSYQGYVSRLDNQ